MKIHNGPFFSTHFITEFSKLSYCLSNHHFNELWQKEGKKRKKIEKKAVNSEFHFPINNEGKNKQKK